VTEEKDKITLWTAGTLLVWMFIFLIGLFPEIMFLLLREAGHVATMRALVNSHWFITFACSAFLGWFTFKRCLECGDYADIAFGKSVQVIILAITAFMPADMEKAFIYYYHAPFGFPRYLLLSVIGVKALAWLYLLVMLLRYYLISGHKVYETIPLVFPSAFLPKEENAVPVAADAENQEQ